LNKSHGTVVQGPPGTGKSHTIANLVCHLLAEGKKVLIISHTARALQVLVNKIPENVSGLCVLLLGNDRAAKDSLNNSVSKILHEYHRWTPKKNIEKINSLKSDLDILRREEAKLLNQLTILREAETKSYQLQFGSYKGTLSQIA
jgi:superfamily II DNA or RNA helicase